MAERAVPGSSEAVSGTRRGTSDETEPHFSGRKQNLLGKVKQRIITDILKGTTEVLVNTNIF